MELSQTDARTIGITYDAGNLQFVSDDPWDWDAEFEASVSVGDMANAMEDGGFPTVMIGGSRELLGNIEQYRGQTHAVFNLTGEPAVAGVLEAVGMNCVGSTMETLAVTAGTQAKYNAVSHGIRTPEFMLVSDTDEMRQDEVPEYPVILKLARGSIGVNEQVKIGNFAELKTHVRYALRTYWQEVLVERFISGPEYDVPIIGTNPDGVFGIAEVVLNSKSLGENYIAPKTAYKDYYGFDVVDAAAGDMFECKMMALKAYNSLHCRDFGSVRIRTEESTGSPYLLRLDACPYVGKHGTFNHVAQSRGMEYKDMIVSIINSALQRCK